MNGSWTAKHHEHHLEDHSRTCKWLVTLIYKPFRPFVKGTTLLRGLTITMVINHVSVRHGMILPLGFNCGLPVFGQTLDSWIPTVEPENPGRQKHHPLQQKETKMLPIPKKKTSWNSDVLLFLLLFYRVLFQNRGLWACEKHTEIQNKAVGSAHFSFFTKTKKKQTIKLWGRWSRWD